jgi:hypothetical protein
MEKAKGYYKNEKGHMLCAICHDPVAWRQTNAGKWYLAVAEIHRLNVSSSNVEKYVEKVVSRTKAAHSNVCAKVVKQAQELENKFTFEDIVAVRNRVAQEILAEQQSKKEGSN